MDNKQKETRAQVVDDWVALALQSATGFTIKES